MIIGLTGSCCAGKDTVAEYLEKKGFIHYSLSDVIRKEADKRKLKRTRDNLLNLGKKLREKHGESILAQKISKKIKKGADYVITSIRHPSEIEILKKHENFYFVNVDAPTKLRFERMVNRKRENDPKLFDEFLALEKRESQESGAGQQITNCRKMAKITLIHDTNNFIRLYNKIEIMISDFKKKEQLNQYERPTWDEYFMKLTFLVAERSTCLRHHVGAITVKDKKVLTTGYNGAASGVKDCLELGCLRDKLNIKSGTRHEICRAIHAEQNAIIQGALHEISLENATLYCTHSPCIMC